MLAPATQHPNTTDHSDSSTPITVREDKIEHQWGNFLNNGVKKGSIVVVLPANEENNNPVGYFVPLKALEQEGFSADGPALTIQNFKEGANPPGIETARLGNDEGPQACIIQKGKGAGLMIYVPAPLFDQTPDLKKCLQTCSQKAQEPSTL